MGSVKMSQLLIFTRQFAAMIASQLQLTYVLENLARETPNKQMREVITSVLDDVLNGVDLSDAIGRFPKVFNEVYVNVVRAGVESGMLGNALTQTALYLEVADEMGRKVRGRVFLSHISVGRLRRGVQRPGVFHSAPVQDHVR